MRSNVDTCSLLKRPPRQLGRLGLGDALALTLLLAEQDRKRLERAGARWHARLVLTRAALGLDDSQRALAAVADLPDAAAAKALAEVARRYRVPNIESALRHLL